VITCAEAVKRLWEYLDDELAEPERKQVEEHLSVCRRCCGESEFANELRRVLRASAAHDLPEDVRSRLVATLDELEAAP
jgi:anti-sigma factor (TIGR02949 family)